MAFGTNLLIHYEANGQQKLYNISKFNTGKKNNIFTNDLVCVYIYYIYVMLVL